jgi:hypothetical protein
LDFTLYSCDGSEEGEVEVEVETQTGVIKQYTKQTQEITIMDIHRFFW